MLTVEEILTQFKSESEQVSRQTLKEAIRQKEAITRHLLAILEDLNEHPHEFLERESDISYLFALYLLAQFRESLAYPLIVKFVSQSPSLVEDLLGDTMTEDLDRILASVGSSNPDLIKGLIKNPNVNEYVKTAVIRTWVIWVARDYLSRDVVISYYREIFQNNILVNNQHLYGCLVSCCCEIGPHELMTEIEQAFEKDLVDPWFIRLPHVEKAVQQSINRTLLLLKKDRHLTFIDDAIEDTKGWLWQPKDNRPHKVKAESMAQVADFKDLLKSKSSQKQKKGGLFPKGFGH